MECLRILVVDDEPGMRTGVERALRGFSVQIPEVGHKVAFTITQAATGEEALDAISGDPPDILLLDHKLPGISGLEILERIRGTESDMLTIMITAYASLDTVITATKRGSYDFLAKPFTPDDLKHVVGKASRHVVLRRQARRLAEEKRQVRFEFISVLAHELKSPIAAIDGFLHIIKDRTAGDEQAVYDHMLSRSMVRLKAMRKMIEDLLDLTHIESGRKRRELAEIDIAGVAGEVVETVMPSAAENNVSLEIHCDGPLKMTADQGEIEMILSNLIVNAVKYNRPGGRVDVTLSTDGDVVNIAVADTGIGMSSDETARLFKEFARIRNPKTRKILGSGLGLSIVKKLVLLYDGDVAVKSEPDKGSTFTVALRRHTAPEEKP